MVGDEKAKSASKSATVEKAKSGAIVEKSASNTTRNINFYDENLIDDFETVIEYCFFMTNISVSS